MYFFREFNLLNVYIDHCSINDMPTINNEDSIENRLVKLGDFVGQEKIISDIRNRIVFSKSNNQPFPNIMLSGGTEMGKNTLARAIAAELGVPFTSFVSDKIKYVGDLASLLTNLSPGNILLIDDISNMKKDIAKIFYKAIESDQLDLIIGKGTSAREVQLELPSFSIIVTTSKSWQIDEKIRRWFVIYDFVSYSDKDIKDIFIKLARSKCFKIDEETAHTLAQYCGGSPGNVNVMIKRISGFLKTISPSLEINNQNISEVLRHLGFGENYPHSLTMTDKLAHMSGIEFELWVAEYFRKRGYEVQTTKTTGDHGIDLLLYKAKKITGVIQCKNWEASIGEPIVRDFYGSMLSVKAPEGYVITTSSFTQQAKDFIQGKPIKLIDMEELLKLAEKSTT